MTPTLLSIAGSTIVIIGVVVKVFRMLYDKIEGLKHNELFHIEKKLNDLVERVAKLEVKVNQK